MSVRNRPRPLALAVALLAVVLQVAQVSPASAAVRTVYYDASRVAAYADEVAAAVSGWNSSVANVRLQAGAPATVVLYADTGWPRARPTGLGSGSIWIGRQAIDRGHDVTRIVAHEFGHILGLPDKRTGLCSDLMSGSSAPTTCTNALPSAAEAAAVDARFAGSTVAPAPAPLVDATVHAG